MRESRSVPVALPTLIAEKLAAFDRLEPAFDASFHYIEEVHGEKRFATFPVAETVRYLHALWICECKDRLLSVPNTPERYQGARGLALLRRWQETDDTAEVVAFFCEKLDSLDVVRLSLQLEAARHSDGESLLARRLMHGRMLLVNRGMNLLHALDPLFALPSETLRDEVWAAGAHYGHTPSEIAEQLGQVDTPRYAFVRHPALAQRNMLVMNMLVMNRLGVVGMASVEATGASGSHVWRIAEPSTPQGPSAEQTIEGYVLLRAPRHNNPRAVRWVDRSESLDLAMTGPQYHGSHTE